MFSLGVNGPLRENLEGFQEGPKPAFVKNVQAYVSVIKITGSGLMGQ